MSHQNDIKLPIAPNALTFILCTGMKEWMSITGCAIATLKTNLGAGHGGTSGRYERLKEISFEYAFLLEQWGLSDLP